MISKIALFALLTTVSAESANEPVSSPGVAIAFAAVGLGMVFYAHFVGTEDTQA